MNALRRRFKHDAGWTFVEATLSVVIMAIMVLGLTIVMLAFKEHLDRSWAVRVMDQYANDVIERLTHDMRNAVAVTVRADGPQSDRFTVRFLDTFVKDRFFEDLWYADPKTGQIKINHQSIIDKYYPPKRGRRGETFEIVKFKLQPYGRGTADYAERVDANFRNKAFLEATYTIEITLRYTRSALNPGERNWSLQKEYSNRVYMRNKNLIVQQGITG